MSSNIFTDILTWSTDQPPWQRDALRRLVSTGELSATDIDELTTICKARHGLAPPTGTLPLTEAHLPIVDPKATSVAMVSLTHHNGVNALAPEQTVSFGEH